MIIVTNEKIINFENVLNVLKIINLTKIYLSFYFSEENWDNIYFDSEQERDQAYQDIIFAYQEGVRAFAIIKKGNSHDSNSN